MASTPMDLDGPESSPANGTPSTSLNITRTLGNNLPSTSTVTDVISGFRPTKLFRRDDIKDGRPQPYILSLDYDDPGELLMTSESDDTIQIYKVREGRHEKQLLSKKYGVKLAKFTHNSSSVVYASTKVNDAIRYLTTHDNAFIRYFEGHEAAVTSLAMHPGHDDFISCSKDNTVRLWNASTKNATGILNLNTPYLSAWDPSGQVFAIGSPNSGQILLYDHRNFDRAPFNTFDIGETCAFADAAYVLKGWTKLEFSNDGKNLLLGTKGNGHFLIDAFEGTLRAYLHKPNGGTRRLAAGEESGVNGASAGSSSNVEGSGDCGFSPDGRYVVGGGANNKLLIWDTLGQVDEDKTLEPVHIIDSERPASVVAFSPRFNFLATADQEVVFWLPDPHA
ncbi:WD40-repeat-containing domain protein [Truncatella angustata]|uniref:WD40-repeat-containing domain protein n=1 Tax=Truncatella angustata TaxID=152316 RepID=A0A9P8UZM1_9PEZI|nr:WD40-repeat-containing domain protein [Truncatella angustata]KAH6661088.1 WD40-repeat-containing domain protein [Truncatella angustata]